MIWLLTLAPVLFIALTGLVDRLIPIRKEQSYLHYESWKNWDSWTDR